MHPKWASPTGCRRPGIHAPRQLDRNIALVGRVVQGMELLSALPRGSGPLGFYERPAEHVPIPVRAR